jgi:hypothetical protein
VGEPCRDRNYLPLLNAVEALKGRDGDKDGNSLLAVADLDLYKIQSQQASSRRQDICCEMCVVPWTASRPIPLMYSAKLLDGGSPSSCLLIPPLVLV